MALALGMLGGLLGLVISGQYWIDDYPDSPTWLTNRFEVVGPALLGLVFVAGSCAALRNRWRAGMIFLCGAPLTAFVLSYPGSGHLVGENDGVYYYLPTLTAASGLTAVFYVPIVVAALTRSKRRLWLVIATAVLAALVFAVSPWSAALLLRLLSWSAVFLLFGSFWRWTGWRGWPRLSAAKPRSGSRMLAVSAAGLLMIVLLAIVGTFAWEIRRSSLWTPDCSGPGLFARPLGPGHTAFTARIVLSGRTERIDGKWEGYWAIGVVQEHFWGLRGWECRLVLIRFNLFHRGETYFVSGSRESGWLTRYLPIVDAVSCSRTYVSPVRLNKPELTVLHNPPADNEYRILGHVWTPQSWTESSRYVPLPGARVRAAASSGTTTAATDGDGMYELKGLQPDTYTLTVLDIPEKQISESLQLTKKDMMEMRLVRLDFYTEWKKYPGVTFPEIKIPAR